MGGAPLLHRLASTISRLPAGLSSFAGLWLPHRVLTGSHLETTFCGMHVVCVREDAAQVKGCNEHHWTSAAVSSDPNPSFPSFELCPPLSS